MYNKQYGRAIIIIGEHYSHNKLGQAGVADPSL